MTYYVRLFETVEGKRIPVTVDCKEIGNVLFLINSCLHNGKNTPIKIMTEEEYLNQKTDDMLEDIR